MGEGYLRGGIPARGDAWILYEPIWKRCGFCFCANMKEPLDVFSVYLTGARNTAL